MQYEIRATRKLDGHECFGTVDVKDEAAAWRRCRSTFKNFVVKPGRFAKRTMDCGIYDCEIHQAAVCHRHFGETIEFVNHEVRPIEKACPNCGEVFWASELPADWESCCQAGTLKRS